MSGVSNVIIYGNNTFSNLYANANTTQAVIFGANSNTTVTTWSVSGTDSGNTIILTSTNTWRYGLIKAGGGTVNATYLNINYSNATPSSTWYATYSTGGGTNSGWSITEPPPAAEPRPAVRLTGAGNLSVSIGSIFDEVTQANINIRPAVFYAREFDEVTKPAGVPGRYLSTGNVQVAGEINETSILSGNVSSLTLLSVTTLATSNSFSSMTLPGTVTSGDLIVWLCMVGNSSISTDPGMLDPSGFSEILSDYASNSSTLDADHFAWYYRIANSSDAGRTVSFSTPDSGANFREASLYVFRPNSPISNVTVGSITVYADKNVSSRTSPPNQSIKMAGTLVTPTVILGHGKSSAGTGSSGSFSPNTGTTTAVTAGFFTQHFIANSYPVNQTFSVSLTGGNFATMTSFYLQVA